MGLLCPKPTGNYAALLAQDGEQVAADSQLVEPNGRLTCREVINHYSIDAPAQWPSAQLAR